MKRVLGVFIVFMLFLGSVPHASAQARGTAGLYGGVNLANFGGESVSDTDILIGGMGGAFASYAVHELVAIGITANFSMQGAKSADDDKTKLNVVNAGVPLYLTPSVQNSPVRPVFFVGPLVSFKVTCTFSNGTSEDCEPEEDIASTTFGVLFGASAVVQNRFFFGGAYNLGLTSLSNEEGVDAFNRVIHIFVGVSFPIGSSNGGM